MQREETITEANLNSQGFRVKSLKQHQAPMSPGALGPVERADGLISQALSSGRSMTEIQALIDMRNAEIARLAKLEYHAAMSDFQEMVPPITRNKLVSFDHKDGQGKTEYEYATLGHTRRTIAKAAKACGFSYDWKTRYEAADVFIKCILSHNGGHSESDEIKGVADGSGKKNSIQAMKSTISYLRRATLESVFGLVQEDDDDDGRAAAYYDRPKVVGKLMKMKTNTPEWNQLVASYSRGHIQIEEIEKQFDLTDDQWSLLKGE